jgi:hypothetical protein
MSYTKLGKQVQISYTTKQYIIEILTAVRVSAQCHSNYGHITIPSNVMKGKETQLHNYFCYTTIEVKTNKNIITIYSLC